METPPAAPGATKKTALNSISKSSLNLTPCRRLGLGRPSTGSLKKSLHLRVVNSIPENKIDCLPSKLDSVSTAVEESAVENCVENFKALEDCSDLLNTPTIGATRVRRCLKTPSPNHIGLTLKRVSGSESTTKNGASEESQCNERLRPISCSKRRRVILKNSSVSSDNDCSVSVSEETETNCYSPACSVGNEIQTPTDVTPEMITQLIATIQDKKKKLEQLKVQDVYAKKHNLTELREQTTKWKTAGQEALRYSMDLARRAGFSVTLPELMAQHGFPPHLMGYNSEDDEFD